MTPNLRVNKAKMTAPHDNSKVSQENNYLQNSNHSFQVPFDKTGYEPSNNNKNQTHTEMPILVETTQTQQVTPHHQFVRSPNKKHIPLDSRNGH